TLYGNSAEKDGSSILSIETDGKGNEVEPQDKDMLMELRNSLVDGKRSDPGPDIVGTITTRGYNLLQRVDPTTTTFRDPDNKHSTNTMNLDLSPFLDTTLRSAPGPDGKPAPTQTLALLKVPGKHNPAIDVIPAAECVVTVTPTDGAGNPVRDPVTGPPLS